MLPPVSAERQRYGACETPRMTRDNDKAGPLDGSTSGTIGGGGPNTGGSTPRPVPPDTPPVDPDNTASGRLAPDPLAATAQRDDLKRGPTDVSSGGHMTNQGERDPNDTEQTRRRGGLEDDLTNALDEDADEDDFDEEDEDDSIEDLQ